MCSCSADYLKHVNNGASQAEGKEKYTQVKKSNWSDMVYKTDSAQSSSNEWKDYELRIFSSTR